MKNKLKVVFVLIAGALAGIIGFQIYWSVSAYKVNKERFDANMVMTFFYFSFISFHPNFSDI